MFVWRRRGEREIDFKESIKDFQELAHIIVGAGKSEILRVAWQAGNIQQEIDVLSPKQSGGKNFFFLGAGGVSAFFF